MNKLVGVFAGFIVAASAGANVILVDYDDGDAANGIHDASVNGGDFDSATATTTAGWDLDYGTGTADWMNNLNGSVGSAGNITLGVATDTYETKVVAIDTGATIAAGQTFDVSYMWRDAFNWDADDTVNMIFYYMDNGTAVDVLTLSSTATDTAGDWDTEEFLNQTYTEDITSAIGETLYVRFDTTATAEASGKGEFARLDNVFISVNVIPEPETLGMLGMGAFLLMAVRKYKKG